MYYVVLQYWGCLEDVYEARPDEIVESDELSSLLHESETDGSDSGDLPIRIFDEFCFYIYQINKLAIAPMDADNVENSTLLGASGDVSPRYNEDDDNSSSLDEEIPKLRVKLTPIEELWTDGRYFKSISLLTCF